MNHVQGNGMQQVRALAWEFWAHGWRGQLLGLAGVVGFASLLYGAISLESDISFRGTEAGTSMHFGFFWVTLFSLGAPIVAAWGAPGRRYTLPTSSVVIVACPMVCSMVSMFVLYALAATTLNLLYDAGWPIWGPGLAAIIVAAMLAGAHLSGFTSEKDSFLAVLWGSCLAPSALALAPLAVWWNRHR